MKADMSLSDGHDFMINPSAQPRIVYFFSSYEKWIHSDYFTVGYKRDEQHLAAEPSVFSLVELQIHDYFLRLHRPHLMPWNDLPAVNNNVNGDFFLSFFFFCKQGFLLCCKWFHKALVSSIFSLALKSVPDAQKAFSWERVPLCNIWKFWLTYASKLCERVCAIFKFIFTVHKLLQKYGIIRNKQQLFT